MVAADAAVFGGEACRPSSLTRMSDCATVSFADSRPTFAQVRPRSSPSRNPSWREGQTQSARNCATCSELQAAGGRLRTTDRADGEVDHGHTQCDSHRADDPEQAD